jgi:hypothetical protein
MKSPPIGNERWAQLHPMGQRFASDGGDTAAGSSKGNDATREVRQESCKEKEGSSIERRMTSEAVKDAGRRRKLPTIMPADWKSESSDLNRKASIRIEKELIL